jgi:hypothetical protein
VSFRTASRALKDAATVRVRHRTDKLSELHSIAQTRVLLRQYGRVNFLQRFTAMSKEDDFHAGIDLIYGAVLNDRLWTEALTRLADLIGTAHIGICAMDRRTQIYESLAPRTDPDWHALYKQYWAFHNPLWALSKTRPANEVYFLDDLMPREDFAATPVYNEWFRPAGFGLAMMGANLHASDEVSALIAVANSPTQDQITNEQARIFKTALRHINRAVRIHHEFRIRDLDHDTTPERLEQTSSGVMLVDRDAKVLFANAWARALLGTGSGLTLHAGRLESTAGSDTLQGLIASCACQFRPPGDRGGETLLRLGQRRSLPVTVTPLRARGSVAELPWLGLQLPVAMVTVGTPAEPKRPNRG